MRRILASNVVLSLALLAIFQIYLPVTPSLAAGAVWSQPTTEFVPNEMIIGFENANNQVFSRIRRHGGVVLEQMPDLGAVRVYVPASIENGFVASMENTKGVTFVERNCIFEAAHIPNDPNWDDQWGMEIIQADSAWDTHKGKSFVLVAIIDGGVDYTHNDLSEHYIPLGYDWVNEDTDPIDDNGHGTHCAGIVAATIDNNIGVTGVAQVSLMAEKVLSDQGGGSSDNVAQGIIHAAVEGADIISMSFGNDVGSMLVKRACSMAWGMGSILVGAAGNIAQSEPHYPAAYPEVIAVSATDRFDNITSYSCYGDWVELSAPGGGRTGDEHDKILSTYLNNTYTWKSGTSMAAPHVSGVAALTWSYNYDLTNQQLREHLHSTADDLGDPGKDQYYGYGRINAHRALNELAPGPPDDPPTCSIENPTDGQEISGVYRVRVKATDDNELSLVKLRIDQESVHAWIDITNNFDGSCYYYDWNTTTISKSSHTLLAKATDNASHPQTTYSPQVTISVTIPNGHCFGNVNHPGSYYHWDYIEQAYGIDLQVDQTDMDLISLAFGCFVDEPWGVGEDLYNPDADINGDGIVDMRDLSTAARNLGKFYEEYWDGYEYLNETVGSSQEETVDFYNTTYFVMHLGQEKYIDEEKVIDTYPAADWDPTWAFPISNSTVGDQYFEDGWFYFGS